MAIIESDLVERILKSEQDAINQYIELRIPFAEKLASSFIRRYPSKKNDILSASYEGLVTAVNNWPNVAYDENIDPYINTKIRGNIRQFLSKDALIPIPKQRYMNGHRLPDVYFFDYSDFDMHPEHTDLRHELSKEDLIKMMHLNEKESQILQMKLAGYTYREIGKTFSKTGAWAHQIMDKIKRKVEEHGQEIFSYARP